MGRAFWVGIASVATILAIVASMAFAPHLLAPQSLADPTQEPLPSAVEVPVWAPGNEWVYDVSKIIDGYGGMAQVLHGQVTKTVTAIETVAGASEAYNVSVTGAFEFAPASYVTPVVHEQRFHYLTASVEGYTLHRTENLARLLDVRTVRLEGTKVVPLDPEHGVEWIAHTSLVVYVRATYTPAWDHWLFPIAENEMWTVKTLASVVGVAVFRVDYPDGWIEIGKRFSFEVPLVYIVKSGVFEQVETLAGVFRAIGTTIERPVGDYVPMEADLATAVELADLERVSHGSAKAWFSPDVRNVVRAVATMSKDETTSIRLEVVLVSYNLG